MTSRELHAHTARTHCLGPCKVERTDWPYDCDAKRQHPGHAVYHCTTHRAWWHEPEGPQGEAVRLFTPAPNQMPGQLTLS